MKKYIVELSKNAKQDLDNIISYLRYDLAGDIIADKYKLFYVIDKEKSKAIVVRIGHVFMDWEKYLKDE